MRYNRSTFSAWGPLVSGGWPAPPFSGGCPWPGRACNVVRVLLLVCWRLVRRVSNGWDEVSPHFSNVTEKKGQKSGWKFLSCFQLAALFLAGGNTFLCACAKCQSPAFTRLIPWIKHLTMTEYKYWARLYIWNQCIYPTCHHLISHKAMKRDRFYINIKNLATWNVNVWEDWNILQNHSVCH